MEWGKRIFITLPPSVADHEHFHFDPAIPLPLELPPGVEEFNAEELNGEMILAGTLRELAENPSGSHAEYYRELVNTLKPGIYNELTEAAILKTKNGDHTTALEIFSLLEGLHPRMPELLLNKALVLEELAYSLENAKQGTEAEAAGAIEAAFDEAETAFENALAFPCMDTLFYTGLFYYRRSDYSRSAEYLAAYLDESSETEEQDDETEKRTKAGELLEEIRKNGLDDEAFKEGLSLIRRGEEEKGILKVRDFLERRPGAGNGWFVLGWGLRRLDRWEDGAACFEKAIELGTVNADALNELAICRMELGDYDEASRLLEKALREEPDNVRLVSNLGILALKQGRDDDAAAFFRTVLELDPNDPIAKAYLDTD